jgi:hypothetical protein
MLRIRNYCPVDISQFHCEPPQFWTFHFTVDQDQAPKMLRIRNYCPVDISQFHCEPPQFWTFHFTVVKDLAPKMLRIRNYYPVDISQFHCEPPQFWTFHFTVDQDLAPKMLRIRIRNIGHNVQGRPYFETFESDTVKNLHSIHPPPSLPLYIYVWPGKCESHTV